VERLPQVFGHSAGQVVKELECCMDFAYSKFLTLASGNLSSFMKAKFLLSDKKEVRHERGRKSGIRNIGF
jgi:hypothetical protein